MSETVKNTLLFCLLIGLCFLIKCKLDTDVTESIGDKKSAPIENLSTKVQESSKTVIDTQAEERAIQEKQFADSIARAKEAAIVAEAQKRAEQKTKAAKAKAAKKKKPIVEKKKVQKRAAKLEFEEMAWDFGKLTAGDIVKKKFKFTNTGNAPLQILGAKATCGCTTPTVPFLDIAPGESNVIGVTYNSVSKEGDQFPELTIESNTSPKFTVIKISGFVTPKPKEEKEEKEKEIASDSIAAKQDSTVKQ